MVRGEQCCYDCSLLHEVVPFAPEWGPAEKGHAWVYLDDPRYTDYARSLKVRKATLEKLGREYLIRLVRSREGNVPMNWYVITDTGREALAALEKLEGNDVSAEG